MPRVIHFEIHATDPEVLIRFYSRLFSWEFKKWDGPVQYWTITTGPDGTPGINGGLVARRGQQSGDAVLAYVCTVDVANLDSAVESALSHGGAMALPKMPIPGLGWLAYCKDPDGNIFGMMQSDPAAR